MDVLQIRNIADTIKQVRIHAKYTISGGIGPIFGGKVALTRSHQDLRQQEDR